MMWSDWSICYSFKHSNNSLEGEKQEWKLDILWCHKGKIKKKLLTTDFKSSKAGKPCIPSSLPLERKAKHLGNPHCVSNLEITLNTLPYSWPFKTWVYSQTYKIGTPF